MASCGDVESANEQDEKTLLARVRRGRAVPEQRAALTQLLQSGSARTGRLLGQLVGDPGVPAELRTTAAVALGNQAAPANERALLSALNQNEPSVVAAAATSLGRIGGPAAFETLSQVEAPAGSVASRKLNFAKTLISYRLGLGEARLRAPAHSAIVPVDAGRAHAIPVERVAADEFRTAAKWLERELPAIRVTERGSVRFSCGATPYWLVLSEVLAGEQALQQLTETNQVVAAVLKESVCPEGWFLDEYILAHPRNRHVVAVFGVRPTGGGTVHFGEMTISDDGTAAIEVRSVDVPGIPAVEIEAELGNSEDLLTIRRSSLMPAAISGKKSPNVPRASSVAPAPRKVPGRRS